MNIPENFDRWMFDYMEGNLSSSEAEAFEGFLLKNPDFEIEADAWGNAKIPIEDVAYPNQQSLERKRRFAGWYGWSAAAMLILLIVSGGFWIMNVDANQSTDSSISNRFSKSNVTHSEKMLAEKNVSTAFNGFLANDLDNQEEENVEREESMMLNIGNFLGASNGAGINQNSEGYANAASNSYGQRTGIAANQNDNTSAGFNSNTYVDAQTTGLLKTSVTEYASVHNAIKQEQQKYNSENHAAQYANNPGELSVDLDLSKKSTVNFNSFGTRTKRLYRQIEKMFGYPIGLVNLRDPELVLPENNLIASNPGFAGGMLVPRFEMSYRNQWLGSEFNVQKVRFAFDNYVSDVKGGVGVAVNAETHGLGAFGDYSIDFAYSPKINLGKNCVLEPGLKVSLGALVGDGPKLNQNGSFELERGLPMDYNFANPNNGTEMLFYQDYGVGAVLNTKWFYAGFSADNLGRHYANVYRSEGEVEPMRSPVLYNGIVGADYESRDKSMTFSPFLSFRQYGENTEAWAGMNYRLGYFTLGGAYSTQNDFTAAIGMKFKKFKLVYQYDRTRTLITNEQIGSHNIGIRFNGGIKKTRFK